MYLDKAADDFVAILWLKSMAVLEVQTIWASYDFR